MFRNSSGSLHKRGQWALAPLALAVCSSLHAAEYTVTDLGTLGGASSYAYDINDAGQVTGQSIKADGATRAFIYAKPPASNTFVMTELPALPGAGSYSVGYGINALGHVAGQADAGGALYPFFYNGTTSVALPISADGGLMNLRGSATDLTDTDVVVGWGSIQSTASDYPKPFSWIPGAASLTYLGNLSSTGDSSPMGAAYAVNAGGFIVGSAFQSVNGSPAFMYTPVTGAVGTMTSLGTLGGPSAQAWGINTGKVIVGRADVNTTNFHAFLYKNAQLTDIGPSTGNSRASDINNAEVVIGTFGTGDLSEFDTSARAFVYTASQLRRDLNALIPATSGWVLAAAEGINQGGQIVGYGVKGGNTHAFLLDPAGTVDAVKPRPAEVTTPVNTATTINLSAKNTKGQTLQKVVIQYSYPAGITVGAITNPSTSPVAAIKTVDTTNRLIKLEWTNVAANAVLEADFPVSASVGADYTLTRSKVEYTLANGTKVVSTGTAVNALIHVTAGPNQAPVASCPRTPSGSTFNVGDTITYNCNVTDPENNPVSFFWTSGIPPANGVSPGPSPVTPPATNAYTFKFATAGSFNVQLNVGDNFTHNGNNQILVFSENLTAVVPPPTVNQPPVVSCPRTPSGSTFNVGDTITYNCNVTDPENNPVSFFWTSGIPPANGVSPGPSPVTPPTTNAYTFKFAAAGSFNVQLNVSDGFVHNGNNQMLVFAENLTAVAPPAGGTVTNVLASPASVTVAVSVNTKISLNAANNQGQTLSSFKAEYKYPSGISPSTATATFSGGTATVKTKTIDTANRLVKFEWTGVTAGTVMSASFNVKSGTRAAYTLTPSRVESTFSNGTKKTGTGNNVVVTVQ